MVNGGLYSIASWAQFYCRGSLKENASQPHPILNFLSRYVGNLDSAALIWIAVALFVGFIKGRHVLSKSVNRSVQRILALPNPTNLMKIYTTSYYFLLGSMVLLGMLIRFAPQDVRGGIDIAVGSALINGALLYFRQAWSARQTT